MFIDRYNNLWVWFFRFPDRRKIEREGESGKILASTSVSNGKEVEELDLISKNPDELVAKIVSCLPLEDAIRTSVLSTRWRGLWKLANLALDFDGSAELRAYYDECYEKKPSTLNARRQRFKNWVDGVVAQLQHNDSKVSMFRVVFNLNIDSKGDIDRWLEFAISKSVESLELELNLYLSEKYTNYVFSDDCYNHIKTRAGLSQIRRLKSLRLDSVDVTGEILEHFIANCTMLEELSVKRSASLTRLRVVGSSRSPLQLTYLELRFCRALKSLEIDHASRLVRFIFISSERIQELRVDNCPALVGMTLSIFSHASYKLRALSGCISQLDSLYLMPNYLFRSLSGMAEHNRLKRLTVEAQENNSSSILGLVSFLNVCPVLHTLQLFWIQLHSYCTKPREPKVKDVVKIRLESIKVVEIVGFTGNGLDREFVEYVMEYFVGLERIVIDRGLTTPIPLDGYGNGGNGRELKPRCSENQAYKAKKIAIRYKSEAPANLEFVIV